MPENNITPEDRLLKIIENPAENTKSRAEFVQKQKRRFTPDLKRLFSLKKGTKFSGFKFKGLSLRFINVALMFLAVLVALFSVFDFARDKARLKSRFAMVSQNAQIEEQLSLKPVLSDADNLENVFKDADEKNIFSLAPVSPGAQTKQEAPQKDITNLKLVGILWSDAPQVMIEDSEAKRTYLLAAGEKISKWKVKKINKTSVIMSGENEDMEWELR